jgi:hypothetical protein
MPKGQQPQPEAAAPIALDIQRWRALTRDEVAEVWKTFAAAPVKPNRQTKKARLKGQNTERRRGAPLIIRTQLTQIDLYCYLKARFGEPNGFQNFLRRDDSDNFIHWEYHLRVDQVDIQFFGSDRQIHVWVGELLTDSQWRDFIVTIKMDFARLGPLKSRVQKTLERWVVFPNKFVQIAHVCEDLYEEISGNIAGFKQYWPPSGTTKAARKTQEAKRLSNRANKINQASMQLALMTPILAEAFINLVILMLCKPEIRADRSAYERFVRAHIHTRVFALSENCSGFVRPITKDMGEFKKFKRVMDRRNHAIHGNIDPLREKLETVYFQGKVPVFADNGDHLGRFYESMERQYRPQAVLDDYVDTYAFLIEIINCLHPRMVDHMWTILDDPYPGFDLGRKIAGRLFPNYVVSGYMMGMRYDDELDVAWP